jgi:hypothetical protein
MTQRDPVFQTIDDTPVEIPTRLRLPQNRTDQMRAFIRHEMSLAAQQQGQESFEEADDVEPDDEEDMPLSRYEAMLLEPTIPLQNGVQAEGPAPADPAPSSEVPATSMAPVV